MLVAEGPEIDRLSVVLPFSPSPLPDSGLSPNSEVDADGLSVSLPPPMAAGNGPLFVAAVTANVVGTELESPSRRTKFTYVLTNPVELNFGRQMGSHDADAELL